LQELSALDHENQSSDDESYAPAFLSSEQDDKSDEHLSCSSEEDNKFEEFYAPLSYIHAISNLEYKKLKGRTHKVAIKNWTLLRIL
jgi:hypothetical protein